MAVKSVPLGFRVHIPVPIEAKMICQTIEERNDIHFLERYPGLFSYVNSEGIFYYLKKGITNNDWAKFGQEDVIKSNRVWIFDGNKIYTVESNFKLLRVNVFMFGIKLIEDLITYTVTSSLNQIELGEFHNPEIGEKIELQVELLNIE
jgi:hypothetical protein